MRSVTVDLLGDGLPAPTVVEGTDLRAIAALRFRPAVAGTLELQLRATDAAGCAAATGLRREVRVR